MHCICSRSIACWEIKPVSRKSIDACCHSALVTSTVDLGCVVNVVLVRSSETVSKLQNLENCLDLRILWISAVPHLLVIF